MKKPSLTAENDSLLRRGLARGLPLWGRGTAIAVDEVLHVYCAKQILSRYVRTQTRTQI